MDFTYGMTSAASSMPGWMIGVCVAVGVIACLYMLIVLIKVFKKAGKPGWHAIIPILNAYDEFEIAEGKGIRFLLLLIPIYNIYVMIKFDIDFAKSFGKDTAFGIGILFLAPIFLGILAFGKDQYVGPVIAEKKE